ncbi:MAG: hypothetical protein E8D47_00990 [Nitrospira sp.]|nr:MAG: hypothetical protein E8D47_00990 [Nitrospira sp.]
MTEKRNILYSDFNCPFCYAMHERLYEMNLLDRCEWRGVQHAPQLPRPMKPWQGSLGAELRHEVNHVQRLAPGLPIALPPGKPNTKLAIEQAVSLLQHDRSHGMAFVRETYRAFWSEGRDISDLAVLIALITQRGSTPESIGAITDETRLVAQEWERAWHATGQAGVPFMISSEGDRLVGCVPPEHIRRFFA